MQRRSTPGRWLVALMVGAAIGSAGTALANHRWSCWKYRDKRISFYNGADNTVRSYRKFWFREVKRDTDSWARSTKLVLKKVPSRGSTDHANLYADKYGNTGWLGLAQISRNSGCIILQGDAFLNRTYLDRGYSNTNIRHVACQEVGHLWGLDHQYRNDTCMNDSILTQPQPNAHDVSLVNSIY